MAMSTCNISAGASRRQVICGRFAGSTSSTCGPPTSSRCWLVPLVLANTIEVFMRYVLGRPTDWAMETTVMSYGALFMLGAAYALQKGAHVRTDMLWEKFSDRNKGLIDSIAYIVLFLPSMAVLFYISLDELTYAWSIGERSTLTPWRPILWPFRAVVPLAALPCCSCKAYRNC